MLYPKIEDCLKETGDCKYVLAALAPKRAKELISHRGMGIARQTSGKELTIALNEIAESKIKANISQPTNPTNPNA
ncbi:MAG: DNA-directed RNA polymerase subunit omega [Christensenellaceae bacterium]|jgi:DNA-directed RNA polymerase omega subunit|nr:DNA-directed RNA polymerase subunit omega [Christensenellaceae bacterium]